MTVCIDSLNHVKTDLDKKKEDKKEPIISDNVLEEEEKKIEKLGLWYDYFNVITPLVTSSISGLLFLQTTGLSLIINVVLLYIPIFRKRIKNQEKRSEKNKTKNLEIHETVNAIEEIINLIDSLIFDISILDASGDFDGESEEYIKLIRKIIKNSNKIYKTDIQFDVSNDD
ncbi:hypothetical protein ES703_25894 [subsurface metagenome]